MTEIFLEDISVELRNVWIQNQEQLIKKIAIMKKFELKKQNHRFEFTNNNMKITAAAQNIKHISEKLTQNMIFKAEVAIGIRV